ncbi:MAG: heavy metal translocating P-type ATPase [Acidobacteriota bacterium]|nr:heavy metal translocating P-type ATPase [Acidobacteriota bacterium]
MRDNLQFRIHGMDCADEVRALRRELEPVVGDPAALQFDILRGKMTVAAGTAAEPAIVAGVARAGLRAELWQEVPRGAGDLSFWQRRGRTTLTIICGALSALGFALHAASSGLLSAFGSEGAGIADAVPRPAVLAYAAAIITGGWYIVPRAWLALTRLRPDMNLLMAVAVLGAAVIGEWFEGAVVTFLFAVSLALESWSVGRARRAVEALLAIAPDTARVLRPTGVTETVKASEVLVGERILVPPAERIPLDGSVTRGASSVNQAPITGESVPVDKAPGASVFAGTINGDGALEIKVSRVAGQSTLAQIIRMVGEAQGRRAPSEQWVDRFAQVYTPVIFAAALLIALVPFLLGAPDPGAWVYRALVLLVIGCPCALVVSTPVSVVASITAAAREGVLIKGGVFVETPAKLRVVALDKTGTLTAGAPEVIDVVPFTDHSREELLSILGGIEGHSDHPLARAILRYVREQNIAPAEASEVQAVQGRGVTARIGGAAYWAGSHRYLEERGQETPDVHTRIEAMSDAGRTVVIVGKDDHVCGFVTLADAVRPESRDAVADLKRAGIERVVMLTGDNHATARRMAAETGIDDVRAELLPADKVAAIEELVREYGNVAMIGDGVNDAPAMGRASLGIAMGAAGSDAAVEAADIALMSDDLSRVPWLIRHSRRTVGVIRQNVALSLAVKVASAVLTFAGFATLWMAIAADMGVTLIVIANALRLLVARPA